MISPIELQAVVPYAAPPVFGALIGYLTNRVAIRMLFRPLKKWTILGIRVPMTPGVIPSKRHLLAENIGEMVGTHLLTGDEIGKALNREAFQNHLSLIIEQRMANVLTRELPSLEQAIPEKYKAYYSIAVQTSVYKLNDNILNHIESDLFKQSTTEFLAPYLEEFLRRDLDSYIDKSQREKGYKLLNKMVKSLIHSKSLEEWLEDFIYTQLNQVVKKKKSLSDILPETLETLILEAVKNKTPDILKKLADLATDPIIQEKIVLGIKKAVDTFSETLGPMGSMVQNFLNIETLEKFIGEYLQEEDGQFAEWLANEDVRNKVAGSLHDRVNHYMQTPIVDLLQKNIDQELGSLSRNITSQLVKVLREPAVIETIFSLLRDNIEVYLEGGNIELKTIIEDLVEHTDDLTIEKRTTNFFVENLRSPYGKKFVSSFLEDSVKKLLQKPIGKLSNFIPQGLIHPLSVSLRNMTTSLLTSEVPGLVDSLNFKEIISDKIDSLDLLKLERLLLSIMEEQFKYINLFGALLGFLIGCANVLIIQLL